MMRQSKGIEDVTARIMLKIVVVKAHPVVPGSSTYRGGERNLKRGVGFQFFRCLELLIRMPVAVSSAFWPSGTVETPIARSYWTVETPIARSY